MICSNSQMVLNKILIKQTQMAFLTCHTNRPEGQQQQFFLDLLIMDFIRQDIKEEISL